MSFLRKAFKQALSESKHQTPEVYYLTLWSVESYYGGPEEGGWWGKDYTPLEYAVFTNEDEAFAAKEKIEELSKQLHRQARTDYLNFQKQQMEFCESRGLDSDFFAESDGPGEYRVTVSNEEPRESFGPRHYE